MGKTITITPEDVTYQDRQRLIVIRWDSIESFEPPPASGEFHRTAYVVGKKDSFSFSSFAFAQFDLIVSVIQVAKRSLAKTMYTI